ncbi:MAG TPA: sigma factor-like helix-turn-helix DNA-binding protein, partial [Solirubrobacteraceae bacterium]|nr:sigma factor-like helix-turn-helix DNA-binding protein [Solirubrobacteraceae bacterium]
IFLEDLRDDTGEIPAVSLVPAADEVVEQRSRLEAVACLPERQQRLVWLHALGWTYNEMAAETEASWRTVDRQLVKARRRLRQEDWEI